MPKANFGLNHRFVQHKQILTFEEINRVAKVFAELGVRKIRITGGEPLVRSNLKTLIYQLSKIAGVHDICMTTNGSFVNAFDRSRS